MFDCETAYMNEKYKKEWFNLKARASQSGSTLLEHEYVNLLQTGKYMLFVIPKAIYCT